MTAINLVFMKGLQISKIYNEEGIFLVGHKMKLIKEMPAQELVDSCEG